MIHRLLQLASSPEILNVRVSRRPLFKAKNDDIREAGWAARKQALFI